MAGLRVDKSYESSEFRSLVNLELGLKGYLVGLG